MPPKRRRSARKLRQVTYPENESGFPTNKSPALTPVAAYDGKFCFIYLSSTFGHTNPYCKSAIGIWSITTNQLAIPNVLPIFVEDRGLARGVGHEHFFSIINRELHTVKYTNSTTKQWMAICNQFFRTLQMRKSFGSSCNVIRSTVYRSGCRVYRQ